MNHSLFDHIQTGSDWLDHPDLVHFLRRHGLQDVKVQLVGPRRTFAGKAWPGWGFIRMVSEGVHPIRWLLTFLHELAHVADFRQRVKDMEKQWQRPYEPGRRDGRQIWRLERPHGERWRQEFIRLTADAIDVGLFPGNESVALAAAEAGSTSLDGVTLNLRSDPRVDAEDLTLRDEQQREWRVQAQLQTEDFKRLFKAGQAVHFDGGPRRGVIAGKLLRINRKSCTVQAEGANWHVPHGFLRAGVPPENLRPVPRPPTPQERFSPGQSVYFRFNGARHEGQIVRVNRKTCTVRTVDGDWRVAFSLLRAVRA